MAYLFPWEIPAAVGLPRKRKDELADMGLRFLNNRGIPKGSSFDEMHTQVATRLASLEARLIERRSEMLLMALEQISAGNTGGTVSHIAYFLAPVKRLGTEITYDAKLHRLILPVENGFSYVDGNLEGFDAGEFALDSNWVHLRMRSSNSSLPSHAIAVGIKEMARLGSSSGDMRTIFAFRKSLEGSAATNTLRPLFRPA